MKIGEILGENQAEVYKKLNKNIKKRRGRRGKHSKNRELSFSDFENMMKHDSYYRGKGGAIKQKKY